MQAPQPLRGIVFDVDGCVARGKSALPGAPETLAELRARGIRCAFMTNENMSTRAQVVARLNGMGIPAGAADVVTSAMVAAEVTRALHPGKKVLAVGGPGLVEALQLCGLELVDAAQAEVVVMGKDPNFNMQSLDMVCQAIWRGAAFIATNYDPKVPVASGFIPATGPMIKAVAYATGQEPLVTGKPSRWAGEMSMKALGVPPESGAVIGDQLEQDIRMGKAAGLFTIAVLTGATTAEAAANAPEDLRPDLVLPDVNALPAWLDSLAG